MLGNWQSRRAEEKLELDKRFRAAMQAEPMDVRQLQSIPEESDGRLVRAIGRFDEARTVFLDNRTHRGVAGFHVITPLFLESGGPPLLVLRGWVASDPAHRARVPELPPLKQAVIVDGLVVVRLPQALQLAEPGPVAPDARIWQYFDLRRYEQWAGLPVRPFMLRQMSPADDRLIREWVQPGASIDKNRSYALQWYSMSAALFGYACFWSLRLMRTRWRPDDKKDSS